MDRTLFAKKLLATTEQLALVERELSEVHQPTMLESVRAAA
jgi:hypothetical protein